MVHTAMVMREAGTQEAISFCWVGFFSRFPAFLIKYPGIFFKRGNFWPYFKNDNGISRQSDAQVDGVGPITNLSWPPAIICQ